VEGYKSPENAVEDLFTVQSIKEKLRFSDEDMDRMLKNWISMAGLDKVAALLGYIKYTPGAADIGNGLVDIFNNLVQIKMKSPGGPDLSISSLDPVPMSTSDFITGGIINGVVVSYFELERDKEKYNDLVEMSQANDRLRRYMDRVRSLLLDKMSRNMAWTIEIDARDIKNVMYWTPGKMTVPVICDAQVELVRQSSGDYTQFTGDYVGTFKFSSTVDMSEYDANFHRYLAKAINDGELSVKLPESFAKATEKLKYEPVSQTVNRPSDTHFTLESKDALVNLSLPEGVRRATLKLPIDTMALEQSEYVCVKDMLSTVALNTESASCTLNWAQMEDSVSGTYYLNSFGELRFYSNVIPYDNPESGSLPIPDMRQYIQMQLTIDMKQ